MRLLDTTNRKLSEFFEQPPPYAILSHTWGAEEIIYQELNRFHESNSSDPYIVSISSRAGYQKVVACCEQALRDGIEWAWVDTCCIDKTSSAELSEAINSMFGWYQDQDVSIPESSFRESRWFKRGWTLQELLAPKQILFFNSHWHLIGQLSEGSELFNVVSEITRIQPVFLKGLDLRHASIAMKMSWASRRETTRKEDTAYCLLGLFDVNMPLLYGEGMKAYARLQEELIKRTYDHSILAWGYLPEDENHVESGPSPLGALASSPADFVSCGDFYLCSRRSRNLSDGYEGTDRSIRVELPLRFIGKGENDGFGEYIAVLDCFSRRHPSRRIAILLCSPRLSANELTDGELFLRKGRILFLSPVKPHGLSPGYGYTTKTIDIAYSEGPNPWPEFKTLYDVKNSVDFPQQYQCEVKYVNPYWKVEEDDHLIGHHSLCIQLHQRRERRTALRESPDTDPLLRVTLIKQCKRIFDKLIDMINNIARGRRPLSQLRIQPNSVITYVQLTKEDNSLESIGPQSFLAIFALEQTSTWWSGRWLLAPLPQPYSQEQQSHPSSLPEKLVGYDSLSNLTETIVVREFQLPVLVDSIVFDVLFRIEAKDNASQQGGYLPREHIGQFCQLFVSCIRSSYGSFLFKVFGFFAVACFVLSVTITESEYLQPLCIFIWVFIFMPFIYEVRDGLGETEEITGKYGRLNVRLMIVFLSIGISAYPMFQKINGWPRL